MVASSAALLSTHVYRLASARAAEMIDRTLSREDGLSGVQACSLHRSSQACGRDVRWSRNGPQLERAPLRNQTIDLLLTISTAPSTVRASCTDGADHRTDSTRCASIIHRAVPRTVPRLRPCPATVRNLAEVALSILANRPGRRRADGFQTYDYNALTCKDVAGPWYLAAYSP